MRFIFNNSNNIFPKVSIILVDWSCRESFHILHYLNKQTVPRDKYEIIWIEYFNKKANEIESWIEKCHFYNKPPVLDKWLIMDMPDKFYYHKHLMYNIGIMVSKGTILTICDSDAIVSPTFIETIIGFFNKNSDVVLHMDEIRSAETRFYPFNYPDIDEILRSKCSNLINGKPKGLVDRSFPFHFPNYGACFSACRQDIIDIGGADEHIDYMGHICGPYEMTFRLINAGKKEIWHPKEWLCHTWHPGQSGDNNYAGPHDGRHMSQTALSIRKTGRVFPLVENPAVRKLRIKKDKKNSESSLFSLALSIAEQDKLRIDVKKYTGVKYWSMDKKIKMMEHKNNSHLGGKYITILPIIIKIYWEILFKVFREGILLTQKSYFPSKNVSKGSLEKGFDSKPLKNKNIKTLFLIITKFFRHLNFTTFYTIERCHQCLKDLNSINVTEVALFGIRSINEVLIFFAMEYSIKIKVFYNTTSKELKDFDILPLENLKAYNGKIIIASFDNTEGLTALLKGAGINPKMIVDLW